jgi:hypothetical protein
MTSMKYFFIGEDWPDFMLRSRDGGLFAVHKSLILRVSQRFADMMWREKIDPTVSLE